VKVSETSR